VRAAEPVFGPLLAAVQAGQAVTFEHRRGGPTGEVVRRIVEPWGVVSWRGRWYLVGHDRDRADVRSFRLSRILEPVTTVGEPGAVRVPPGTDLMASIRRNFDYGPVTGMARVWVREGHAHGLRRLGTLVESRDGGDVLEIELRSERTVARWLAGAGPDVRVLEPPALVAHVRRLWERALEAHS
jgi:proteasome accessory factor B